MMNKLCVALFLSVFALAVGNAEVSGQTQLGAQLSYGDKADFGLGARVEVPIRNFGQGLRGIGSLDLFFPDNDNNHFELNGNIAYGFSIEGNNSLFPYVGSGLSLAHMSDGNDNSNTDLGLNLLAGTAFAAEHLSPFVEARFEVGGGEQLVITAGVLF
jgi:hypothetical protein